MLKWHRFIGLTISSKETGLKNHYHLIFSVIEINFGSEKPRKK